MKVTAQASLITLIGLLAIACAPTAMPRPAPEGGPTSPSPNQTRTLVIANRSEPDSLSDKPLARISGGGDTEVPRLFNAGLALDNDRGLAIPYLAETLPELNTNNWRVSPDGRMETTFRLRPNLTWHDGKALTADDFVFAWQVYLMPDFGLASQPPVNQIETVTAVDPRTLVIQWKRPYPDAAGLRPIDFQALPRHILESELQKESGIAFAGHNFWTTDYVGSGPYRLDHWEPGSFLEAVAFPGHALGRPKIERVQVRIIADSNAVLAGLLSGDLHFSTRSALETPQGVYLKRDWAPRTGGGVLIIPSYWRRADLQHRQEYTVPQALSLPQVRRALSHAMDRQAQVDGVFEGEAIIADSLIPPGARYFADVDRAIAKYPLDLRRTESLMNEAGWSKGPDGVFASPSQGRFLIELKVNASVEGGTELSITGDALRRAGFDIREVAVPRAQQRDGEVRSTFPALYLGGGGIGEKDTLPNLLSTTIPRAENRWVGLNRGGWANAEYDRLFDAFSNTLPRPERDQLVVQMARLVTEEVASISLVFYPAVVAYAPGLVGLREYVGTSVVVWNVHEWEWV